MKKLKLILELAGAVVAACLAVYLFFSTRSCVQERRWLALGPIENHPVRIYDVKYSKEFNDLNGVQLEVAEDIGVPPVADREEAIEITRKLSRRFIQDEAYIEEEIRTAGARVQVLVLEPEHITGKQVNES